MGHLDIDLNSIQGVIYYVFTIAVSTHELFYKSIAIQVPIQHVYFIFVLRSCIETEGPNCMLNNEFCTVKGGIC